MGLLVQDASGVTKVVIDHGKVNALDLELCREITTTFNDLSRQPESGGIVLTGRDAVFSGGVDVEWILAAEAADVDAFLAALSDAFLAVLRCDRPVIAAVNGHAIAGGAVLARAADIVIAGGSGRIGLVELGVGVPFPPAAVEVLRARLGNARAWPLVLAATADSFDVHLGGLVDRVVERTALLEAAEGQARRLGRVPAQTYSLTKKVFLEPVEATVERSAARWDAPVARAWSSDEVRAAIRASIDERAKRG